MLIRSRKAPLQVGNGPAYPGGASSGYVWADAVAAPPSTVVAMTPMTATAAAIRFLICTWNLHPRRAPPGSGGASASGWRTEVQASLQAVCNAQVRAPAAEIPGRGF